LRLLQPLTDNASSSATHATACLRGLSLIPNSSLHRFSA
jgi:hypothetical protein